MLSQHWGEFKCDIPEFTKPEKENDSDTLPSESEDKQYDDDYEKYLKNKKKIRKVENGYFENNELVKQTVEVMDQSDLIKDLIETYRPGHNLVFNPCHATPKLEVLSSCDINFVNEKKFLKPLWFIPPDQTKFTEGRPVEIKEISKQYLNLTLRKSLCGLLRIKHFTHSNNSALLTFIDAIDEFYKNFMEHIRTELLHTGKETEFNIDILSLEKAYISLTKQSLLTLHNYYKNEMIKRNRSEVEEFKDKYQEYDKVMQMNQKPPNIKEEDLASYLEYTDSNSYMSNQGLSVQNIFDGGETSSLGEIFDREYIHSHENINLSVGPSSNEN